jgi:hypothetical protein
VKRAVVLASPWQAAALLDGNAAGSSPEPRLDVLGVEWSLDRVDSVAAALERVEAGRVDLLLVCGSPVSGSLAALAAACSLAGRGIFLVAIARDPLDLPALADAARAGLLDETFLDDGRGTLLPAILHLAVDRQRTASSGDTHPVLLLVEDETAFASFLLAEVHACLGPAAAGVVVALARCFEAAEAVIDSAGERLVGVVSDLGYPRGGRLDSLAGLTLLRQARRRWPSLPVLAQSFEAVKASEAEAYGFPFTAKRAADYAERLRSLLADCGLLRVEVKETVSEAAGQLRGSITLVGKGPLGGRLRGLLHLAGSLSAAGELVPGVRAGLPQTLALLPSVGRELAAAANVESATDWAFPPNQASIARRVAASDLPEAARRALQEILSRVGGPLVVSASTTLDELPGGPVNRVFPVFVISDRGQDDRARLECLEDAAKRVFAAAALPAVAESVEGTPFGPDQLLVSVLVQEVPGTERGGVFLPLVTVRAWSHNAYPFPGMAPEDGAAELLLGVAGQEWSQEALRFCPAHPGVLPQMSAVDDILHNAQRKFQAIQLARVRSAGQATAWDEALTEADVSEIAGELGAADMVSTFLQDAERVVDGVRQDGVPLLTFAGLLRGRRMPLPAALHSLLGVARRAFGEPVELRVAAEPGLNESCHALLLTDACPAGRAIQSLSCGTSGRTVVRSVHSLGLAGSWSFADVVVILPGLDRARTTEVAGLLELVNRELAVAGRRYLLIGPGRWGSRDPWLGIPVAWTQISAVGAIVETDFTGFEGDPSFGSHFFHTLTSQGIPFLPVHRSLGVGQVDWGYLNACTCRKELLDGLLRVLICDPPLEVRLEGASRVGLVVSLDRG